MAAICALLPATALCGPKTFAAVIRRAVAKD
jgi:hypothetical protein